MELIIDQGNTFTKVALFEGDQLLEVQTFDNIIHIQIDKLLPALENKYTQFGKIRSSIFSSVGTVPEEMIQSLSQNLRLYRLDANIRLPITIRYETPETLGNDRIALAVAGASQFPNEHVLVIDAGTCITYDYVNREREYLGGAISPGITMRFKALNTFTSKLPLIHQTDNPSLIGSSTKASIQSGVINGVIAEVMGIIKQYKTKYPSLKVIFTGGDLKYFDKNTKSDIFANPNLILVGLKEILEYNAKL